MKLSMLILILLTFAAFPQLKELEVKPTENHGMFPVNRDNPEKAAIFFYTQFDNLDIWSSYGIKEIKGDPKGGKYIVIVEPVRQTIEVRAPGYKTEIIKINDLKPLDVLYFEVLPKNYPGLQGVSEIAITVQATPVDASVTLDGEPLKNNVSNKVRVGTHKLRVEKSGYTTFEQEIMASPDMTFFPVVLSLKDPVEVRINSDPPDADILIDGLSQGKTPKLIIRHPGTYEVRLNLTGYLPVFEKITVSEDEKKNNFKYDLVKNMGKLKLEVTPLTATVRLNKKIIDAAQIQELIAGFYQIEVEAETFYPYTGTIEIIRGETKTEKITLNQKAGKLQFTINPPEAECVLAQNGVEKYRWIGLKLLSSIAEGIYELTAVAIGHQTFRKRITIYENQTTVEDIQMSPDIDRSTSIPEDMIFVEGGTFEMGSNDGQGDEKPLHGVTVAQFLIGRTEVTLRQFEEFIQSTGYETDADKWGGSFVISDDIDGMKPGVNWRCDRKGIPRPDREKEHPVIHVSWNDAVTFCNWMSAKEGLHKAYTGSGSRIACDFSSNGYRLPTEAEWEFAARGGTKSKGYIYSGSNDLNQVGWYNDNSGKETKEVGKKVANELGLFDMSGNVWEWCWDWYSDSYYNNSSELNPLGPDNGSYRVLRGGGWVSGAKSHRVADRVQGAPEDRSNYIGFRLARTKN